MNDEYRVLQVLFEIVKDKPQPLLYTVSIRELLLRLKGNWQSEYLEALSQQDLITVRKTDSVVVQITEKGMQKAQGVSV
jgi:predicted transcriptional regulator